jgi:nucleotide-binding universal stress UspA family protein
MSKPVVVGIAGTKEANVLTYGVEEARRSDSVLRVVHSVVTSPQAANYYAGVEMLEELRAEGRAVLDEAKEHIDRLGADIAVDYILDNTPPVVALKRLSAEARLLVVGSDDVPWFGRLIRARVAGHLALHAECPVTAVPRESVTPGYEGDVILTLDGETSADGPIRFAFEQAARRESPLVVLHVALPGTLADDSQAATANISEVMVGWSAEFPATKVVKTFIDGDPLDAIIHVTKRAGLVVVGRPHTHLSLVGVTHPLATLVLRHAHSSVAVVPAAYPGA